MARHIRKQFPGAKYDVTNRGNGRQEIFTESGDCGRFVEQLAEAVERDKVILYGRLRRDGDERDQQTR